MKITINRRNKIIIYVLLGILVFAGYYQLVLKYQQKNISALQNELSMYDEKLDSYNINQEYDKQLDSDIEEYAEKVTTKVEDFFPSVIQEKIIVILDSMVNSSVLSCTNMSFTPSTIEQLSLEEGVSEDTIFTLNELVEEYNELKETETIEDNEQQDTNESEEVDNIDETETSIEEETTDITEDTENTDTESIFEVEKMNVSLQLSGTYSNLTSFISTLKAYDHRIVINNVSISADGGEAVTASMNVDFYSVPKLMIDDSDYLQWDYSDTYGKTNPFQ
ncbi:hypothetical protein [Clostridium sp. DL1XJH146]